MIFPNFLLIGAAKCGTTSLHAYLSQHPQVFMSVPKEPHFMAFGEGGLADVRGPTTTMKDRAVVTREAYEALFERSAGARAIGEASVSSLAYERACARIRRYCPEARLLVVLRQPADQMYSSFCFNRWLLREPLKSLPHALHDEQRRRELGWLHSLQYSRASNYQAQLERYVDAFPREQIHVFLYDDLVADAAGFMRRVYAAVGVDPSFQAAIDKRVNVTKSPRNTALHWLVTQPNGLRAMAKRVLPRRLRTWVGRWVGKYNHIRPAPFDPHVRAELTRLHRPNILRLQTMIGRDLSHWLA
jgi:Sulfotransferase family